jgi:hypothetical protein
MRHRRKQAASDPQLSVPPSGEDVVELEPALGIDPRVKHSAAKEYNLATGESCERKAVCKCRRGTEEKRVEM